MTPERELEELIYDHIAEENSAFPIRRSLVQSRIRGHPPCPQTWVDTDGAAVAFVIMFPIA
jgi:hypothetical protein